MKLGRTQGAILGLAAATLSACATAGSTWFEQGNTADDDTVETPRPNEKRAVEQSAPPDPARFETRVLGSEQEEEPVLSSTAPNPHEPVVGRVLGTFRNTYYDFPLESDFDGNPVTLHDVRCGSITDVPRGFYEAVCVQGSGILTTGQTISFAKRGCDCAEVCPKTGEKICFEALDATKFPWGRGALGLPITPLLTVAVDDSLVPMGTPIYIPGVRRSTRRSRPLRVPRRLLHRARSRPPRQGRARRRLHRHGRHDAALESARPDEPRRHGRPRQPPVRSRGAVKRRGTRRCTRAAVHLA